MNAAFAVFSGLNFLCCASGSCLALYQVMVCSAFGMAHGPSLLRVMELSALLVQSQKQNEEKEKAMKTLHDTVEILVCFTFIWEIAQCLLSSLSTRRCGFLKRKSGKDANCLGTSGPLPKDSSCVWDMRSQSRWRPWQGSCRQLRCFPPGGCTNAILPGTLSL